MNQSNQLAAATGSMGVVSALGITIQWMLGLIQITATTDQAAALAILLFPIVHFWFLKLGAHMDSQQPKDRRVEDKKEEPAK